MGIFFLGVLLCTEVAVALSVRLEQISTEMVFRGLYHFSRAVLRDEADDVVIYLAPALQAPGIDSGLTQELSETLIP